MSPRKRLHFLAKSDDRGTRSVVKTQDLAPAPPKMTLQEWKDRIATAQTDLSGLVTNASGLSDVYRTVADEITGLSLESEPANLSAAFQGLRTLEATIAQTEMKVGELGLIAVSWVEALDNLSADTEATNAMQALQLRIDEMTPKISSLIGKYEIGIQRLAADMALIYTQRQEDRQRKFQNLIAFLTAIITVLVAAFTIFDIVRKL